MENNNHHNLEFWTSVTFLSIATFQERPADLYQVCFDHRLIKTREKRSRKIKEPIMKRTYFI